MQRFFSQELVLVLWLLFCHGGDACPTAGEYSLKFCDCFLLSSICTVSLLNDFFYPPLPPIDHLVYFLGRLSSNVWWPLAAILVLRWGTEKQSGTRGAWAGLLPHSRRWGLALPWRPPGQNPSSVAAGAWGTKWEDRPGPPCAVRLPLSHPCESSGLQHSQLGHGLSLWSTAKNMCLIEGLWGQSMVCSHPAERSHVDCWRKVRYTHMAKLQIVQNGDSQSPSSQVPTVWPVTLHGGNGHCSSFLVYP